MPLPRLVFFFITSFLADATTMLILPLLSIHAARSFGASALALSIMGTSNAAGYALMSYLAGRLSDRTGRRVWVVTGALAHLAGCAIIPHITTLHTYMIVVIAQMSLLGCFWAPLMGWLSETTSPSLLARSISRWNMVWCAGTISGSFAGGYLYDHVTLAAPFYAGAACMIPVLLIFAFGNPIAAPQRKAAPHLTHPHALRFTIQAWLTLGGSMFVVNLLVYLFPKVLELKNFSVEAHKIGNQHGVRLIAMFIMFWLLGRTTRWHFQRWPAQLAFALLCLVAILAAFTRREEFFYASFLVLGIAMGIAYGLSVYYSMMLPAKGHMGGMHEALMSSGGMLGPFFGGVIIQATSSARLTFLACLVPLMVVWAYCIKLAWKLPPPIAAGASHDSAF